jgi:hypothetical protein
MHKEPPKFQQVSPDAFFIVEPSSFNTGITGYSPTLANQTIIYNWNTSNMVSSQSPDVEVRETHEEIEVY